MAALRGTFGIHERTRVRREPGVSDLHHEARWDRRRKRRPRQPAGLVAGRLAARLLWKQRGHLHDEGGWDRRRERDPELGLRLQPGVAAASEPPARLLERARDSVVAVAA